MFWYFETNAQKYHGFAKNNEFSWITCIWPQFVSQLYGLDGTILLVIAWRQPRRVLYSPQADS